MLKKYFSYLLTLLWILKKKRKKNRFSPKRNILVIRLDAIGDFFIWFHSALEIRKKYPKNEYRIFLVGNQEWLLFAKMFLEFDYHIAVDKKKFSNNKKYRKTIINDIFAFSYETVFNPTFSREWWSDLLVLAAPSTIKYGYNGDTSTINPLLKIISNQFYTFLVTPLNSKMELVNNAEFIRKTINSNYKATLEILPIKRKTKNQCLLFLDASWKGKRWPIKNYISLAKNILNETDFNIVICSGPTQKSLGDEFVLELNDSRIINLCGRTNLLELLDNIAETKIVISNDTCVIHMAQTLRVPSICLLGGGHFGRFLPYQTEDNTESTINAICKKMECYQCQWNCVHKLNNGHARCLDEINVNIVTDKFMEIIGDYKIT